MRRLTAVGCGFGAAVLALSLAGEARAQQGRGAGERALDRLDEVEEASAEDIAAARALLGQADGDLRRRAAELLASWGAAAALSEAIAAPGPGRLDAIKALGAMGPKGRPACGRLIAALKDEDKEVRRFAASSLGHLGGGEAGPALRAAAADESWRVRRSVAFALGRLSGDEAPDAACLRGLLDDDNSGVRAMAAAALCRRPADKKAACKALVGALKDKSFPVVLEVLRGLPSLGKAGAGAAGAVAALLTDGRCLVRSLAARCLGDLGSGASSATPALAKATADRFAEVRRAACRALGRIGGKGARAAVEARLGDEDAAVRRAAAAAVLALDQNKKAKN